MLASLAISKCITLPRAVLFSFGPCLGCRLPHPNSGWPALAVGPRGTWQSGWRHRCPLIRLCAPVGYGCTMPRTRSLRCTPIGSESEILIRSRSLWAAVRLCNEFLIDVSIPPTLSHTTVYSILLI